MRCRMRASKGHKLTQGLAQPNLVPKVRLIHTVPRAGPELTPDPSGGG